MAANASPFRVSPSVVARYFSLDCDRYLRYRATPEHDLVAAGVPAADFDHSPLMRDVTESGLAWEETVVGELLDGRVAVGPGTGPLRDRRFDAAATLDLLRAEPAGRFVYQATLRPPPRFYAAHGLPPGLVGFGDCHPDLIEVRDDPAGRVFRVIDVKRGDAVEVVHRVQVLLYALILDAVLADAGVADARVDLDAGGVWLGGRPAYDPADLAPLRPYVARFLRETLPAVLAGPADRAGWHVTFACERCGYFAHCRDEMRRADDLARLTNITPHGKRHLVALGVRTLPALDAFLRRPHADDLLGRCASLAGERHYLEGRLAAFRDGRPHPHAGSAPLPKGENVAVVLTLQREPLGRATYLAGLLVHARPEHAAAFSPAVRAELFDAAGKPRPYVRVADRPDAATALRDEVVRFLHAVLADVHRYNTGRPWEQQLSLQTYTHTDRDRDQLTAWLLAGLDDPALAPAAAALLLHFQCPDLVLADDHPGQPVPYPVVVLQNVLTKTVALPVEVSYTLPESLAALGAGYAYPRKEYFHYPLGHGLRSEAVHAAWHLGRPDRLADLRAEAAAYLYALRSLLWAVRQHLAGHLFAWPPKFALPADLGVADPLLSRLAFFARYESVTAYLAVREGRAAPDAVRERVGAAARLRAAGEAEFEVDGDTAAEVEAGGPPGWLLSRATPAGRQAQLEFRDYAARSKMFMKPSPHVALVAVERVDQDAAGPRAVRVRYATRFDGPPPQSGELFHLQPRFTDFTTDRVVDHLRELDRAGGGLLVPVLRDPAGVARVRPLPPEVEAAAAAAEAGFGLTVSQRDAYREVRRRRLVLVWGPPGTGKTHCLAATILGLAAAHAAAGRPFRVLVTAFTHAAIENLLRKVAGLAGSGGPAVGKVKGWQGAAAGEAVKEEQLGGWLAGRPVAVAGATVYACLKALKAGGLAGFDLVVVDEASQMRPAEAAVPVGLVAADGRLVLAGDDLQLPPVVQGAYPDPEPGEPVLHRSVFEAVRSRLPAGSPVVRKLLENRRMNDVLTSFAAGLLYGPDYRCFDAAVAGRRIGLAPGAASPLVEACLDPAYPLVVVVLEGHQAAKTSPVEAALAADVVAALRERLLTGDGLPHTNDGWFFRAGVFVVCPHRAQNRAVRRELATRRDWASPPFVDTVDKTQGQEADAVVISYGVADPEFALAEARFIYSANRLNVAVTRARAKCVAFLPRPLLDSLPGVLDDPDASRGLAYMRGLVDAAAGASAPLRIDLDGGVAAVVYRAGAVLAPQGGA